MARWDRDSERRRWRRPGTMAVIATVAAILLAGSVAPAPAMAAEGALRVAVASTYRVDPAKAAVHVTLDVTATNQKTDTSRFVYFYDSLVFGVQSEAKSLVATSNGRRLAVSSTARDGFRAVEISYPNLYHGQTRKVRLSFDLPSGKPRSASAIRVGRAHAEFGVWAWGDPGLADVRILLPGHFIADVQALPADTSDTFTSSVVGGQLDYTARGIDDVDTWYARVDASDRDALTDTPLTLAGDRKVHVHAWPEDPTWLRRVSSVLEESLPDLEAAVGLPWPVTDTLGVSEVSSAQIEGYAGVYDTVYDEIRISEELDEHVIVHEASHAWFDDHLVLQRWIFEGLADEYASRIVAGNDPAASEDPSPVTPDDKAAFPLNGWAPPSRIDEETDAVERFGYEASWTVIRAIVTEVGEPRMRDVFQAASKRTLTYVGAGPAEPAGNVADWRRFLDLVDGIGGSTKADALFDTWVVTPFQRTELEARATARTRYAALLATGEDWLPGVLVRKPMSDWQFKFAGEQMGEAEAVLADRDALRTATTEAGLPFPIALEPVYEAADAKDDLTALDSRIEAWLRAATAVRSARDALAAERAPLVALGLLGTQPDSGFVTAMSAFAAGDDPAAVAGSNATLAVLAGAEEIGRGRAITVGGALVAILLVLLLVAFSLRRRRRRAPIAATAEPYATLAATPDPVGPVEAGDAGAGGTEPD